MALFTFSVLSQPHHTNFRIVLCTAFYGLHHIRGKMMKHKKVSQKVDSLASQDTTKKKRRTIKVIFTPLSLIFYAGIGYMIYRRIRRSQQAEPKPIIATA